MKRILIVGAGLYGAVCARELSDLGHSVRVIEQRPYIGGNCHTRFDVRSGSHEHVHGAHIFHTRSERIWRYVQRFARFNGYVHRVQTRRDGQSYSMPINLRTMRQVFGVLTADEARACIELDRAGCPAGTDPARPSVESHCLATIGPTLYRLLIEGYTRKQWQRDPRELPASIVQRLPLRFTDDDRYFDDTYQGIPEGGYTAMFERMLRGVRVDTGIDFLADRAHWMARHDLVIYTGPLDAFFGHCHGALEYRSLRFEREWLPGDDAQGAAVVNQADPGVPYTRVLEHRHFDPPARPTGQTLVTREYALDWQPGLEPYYPVGTPVNQARFERYRSLAESPDLAGHLHFGGRLAEYRYYDMHQVIGAALSFVSRFAQGEGGSASDWALPLEGDWDPRRRSA